MKNIIIKATCGLAVLLWILAAMALDSCPIGGSIVVCICSIYLLLVAYANDLFE